jgi:hypothetical protein
MDSIRQHLERLLSEIASERLQQITNWPDCEHLPDGTGGVAVRQWSMEIAKHACDRAYREGEITHAHVFEEEAMEVLAETDPEKLREELIQVMAVCAKWVKDLDESRISRQDAHCILT